MQRVNTFAQFQSKRDTHEDVLTRAYLVLLRLVPDVHESFLTLIDKARQPTSPALPALKGLAPETIAFSTQSSQLPSGVRRVLSILLTDEAFGNSITVRDSDRRPVYDGIISYGTEWAFTIENKPRHEDVWTGQLSPNLPDGANVYLEKTAVVLEWREAIGGLRTLLEQGSLHHIAATLIRDFLDFTFHTFPHLNPYDSLAVCGDNEDLIRARCRQLMEEIAPGKVDYHKDWRDYISFDDAICQMAALDVEGRKGERHPALFLHPGVTVAQARRLYRKLDLKKLTALSDAGWHVAPDLHLSFLGTGLVFPKGTISVVAYVRFWKKHPDLIGQRSLQEADAFLDFVNRLVKLAIINESYVDEIREKTVETQRTTINVCPGISLRFDWTRKTATDLDTNGELVGSVEARIREAFGCWGQKLQRPTKNPRGIS